MESVEIDGESEAESEQEREEGIEEEVEMELEADEREAEHNGPQYVEADSDDEDDFNVEEVSMVSRKVSH